MTFQPGQSGNPSGYKGPRWGNRHKIHREVLEQIKGLGHKDCLLTLSEIQNDPNKDDTVRVSAAIGLARFVHPSLQAIPVPRYIERPINIPDFHTVEDATKYLGTIPGLIARGELDLDFAESITKGIVFWIQSQHSQSGLDLKAQAQGASDHDQIIRIEGGLPSLPGTNISMPPREVVNGKTTYDLLEHQNPSSVDGVHTPEPATPTESILPVTDPQDPT
jgi:hypothetical protein